jgi:hypothetical protein
VTVTANAQRCWAADLAAYGFIKQAPLADLAWEFLRRNPAYRADYERSQGALKRLPDRSGIPVFCEEQVSASARRWGLHSTPDPDASAESVIPFWVLKPAPVTIALPIGGSHRCLDLSFLLRRTFQPRLFIAAGGGHFLDLTLSGRLYRLPVQSETGAEPLTLTITDMGRFPEATALLSQMSAVLAKQRAVQPQPPAWTAERLRLRLALIALDGMAARASYREIAAAIYGLKRANEAWASSSRALKDQIRRACQRGKELMAGAYCKLVAGLDVADEETLPSTLL